MNLKKIRIARGYSQKELALLTKTTEANISKYETGFAEPSINTLINLAKALNITIDELLQNGNNEVYIINENDISILKRAAEIISKLEKKETIKTNDFKQRVDRKRKTQSLNGITQHNEVKEINNNQGKIVIGINNEDNSH